MENDYFEMIFFVFNDFLLHFIEYNDFFEREN